MDPFLLCAFIPIKIYSNAEQDKSKILSDNKNKSGIYMWKNSKNGKCYIGSSDTLKRRFHEYFNTNYLLKRNYMAICCAPMSGRKHSDETKQILSEVNKGKIILIMVKLGAMKLKQKYRTLLKDNQNPQDQKVPSLKQ